MKLAKLITTILLSAFITVNIAFSEAELGEKAPNFTVTDINDQKVALSDYLGKTVVLEWHNPNCPFVVKHYDSNNMQTLQSRYKEKGVVWLTINSGAKGKSGAFTAKEIKKYLMKKKANPSKYISDYEGSIGKAYGAKTTPHMYIVSSKGILVYKGAIDSNSSARPETIKDATNYVSKALDELLASKEVSTNDTEAYGCSVKY